MTDLVETDPVGQVPSKAPATKPLTAPEIAKLTEARQVITDKLLDRLRKRTAPAGKRIDIRDALVPGFAVRLTGKGHLSYVYAGRFAGQHWTRREIAAVGAITLAKARDTARDWIALAKAGKDPKQEEERRQREEARTKAVTFAAVAEDYITERVVGHNPARPIMRKARWVTSIIRKSFVSVWQERPIAAIDRSTVLQLIKPKVKTKPGAAREQLAIIKSLFSWALDQDYGLDRSPCSEIKPSAVVGGKNTRDRALSDDEVRALWHAADAIGYPAGRVYQLLLLSGLRLNEVAKASRSEFNLKKKEWIIPAARMKGKNVGSGGRKARPHLVPLTADILKLFDQLPTFKHGDFLFSTTFGRKPSHLGSKVKRAIDAKILEQLRIMAKARGDDPKKVELEPWWNHDTRRTVRSNLSALKIKTEVSEAVLSHAKVGIIGVYDLHDYADEKREALQAWGDRLREIVNPPEPEPEADNIVPMRRKA